MPKVKAGESEQDYVSRCVPYVLKEGTAKTQDQALGLCYGLYKQSKKEKKAMNENEIERRTFKVELKADSKNGAPIMRGIAAVFNSLSEDLGGFREMIAPGAFRDAIVTSDVRALYNHNPDMVLGRTKSGTLKLEENDTGLAFEVEPPDTSFARDLQVSMQRGDIDQCSFGFTVEKGGATIERSSDGILVRTINKIKALYDVSPVTYPAYAQTSCAVRDTVSLKIEEELKEELAAKEAEERSKVPEFNNGEINKMRLQLETQL